jgi:hypothetical protein
MLPVWGACPKSRGHKFTQADLWALVSPQHFDDMPTNRPSGFPDTGAFELSR